MRNNEGVCEIITLLIAKKISSSEASELLCRSSRQVRRIRQRYEADGLETLVHGNQGLRPNVVPPIRREKRSSSTAATSTPSLSRQQAAS